MTASAPPPTLVDAPLSPGPAAAGDAGAMITRFIQRVGHRVARERLVLVTTTGCHSVAAASTVRNSPVLPGFEIVHAPSTHPLLLANLQLLLGDAPGRPAGLPTRTAEPEWLANAIDELFASPEACATAADGRSQHCAPLNSAAPQMVRGSTDHTAIGVAGRVIALNAAEFAQRDGEDTGGIGSAIAQAASLLHDRDLLAVDGKGPIVRLVDLVLFEAITRAASDVHIQPLAGTLLIRLRVDGVLRTVRTAPASLGPAIASRVKVMARLDVAERRVAQDGRATVTLGRGTAGSQAVDLRISTMPTAFGERVVIRLLYNAGHRARTQIDGLGMPPDLQQRFLSHACRSSGIVLVTGPTGSGKTTTLYATLRWMLARPGVEPDVNVMTIEDPIEYDLSASDAAQNEGQDEGQSSSASSAMRRPTVLPISQTQIDAKKGLTFAVGLRHILRQDPDVIMVGEIRDAETARTAIQASLTGHLVLSSLHTNDAPSAVARLIDLDVEPFLIASTLSAVLAQRLVRTVHPNCAGVGCRECLRTGFRGRIGLFELLTTSEAIRAAVQSRRPASDLRDIAVREGMVRLEDAGRNLISRGITTHAEVQRATLGVE